MLYAFQSNKIIGVFLLLASMRISLFSWVCLILTCHSIFPGTNFLVVSGQCLEDQKSLLLQLKNDLQFDIYAELLGWNQSVDCCLWDGVTCNVGGQVTGLDLSSRLILGGIDNSSSLFGLRYLQSLNLSNNRFTSTIPPGLGRLVRLKFLNFSNSGFRGQIPVEISRMTRLVSLDFSSQTYFTGMPTLQLGNPNLTVLVENLSELTELYLDGVNISAKGNEWCYAISSSLTKLRVLSLSYCYLSGPIDSSLSRLQFLSVIQLGSNNLSSPVPYFLAGFLNLTSVRLGSSGLLGEFPKKIFQVPTLQTIDISGNNKLQGSLPEFSYGGSLQTLVLRDTKFSGSLPDSIGKLKLLSRIELANCNFSGPIPSSVENLTQLVYVDLSSNRFTGPIPSFNMSKNLSNIILSRNGLFGQIPAHWEGFRNLVVLGLVNNKLSGSIPGSLFSLPSLQKLDLSNNQFSGLLYVPNVSASHLLDCLDLSSNNLEGPIPLSLFELRGLTFLSLSSNNFSGSLLLDITQQLVNLSYIDLSFNSLSIDYNGTDSSLPLPQMTILKLASCKLGKFPDFLKNQSSLRHLDLSMNQIQGNIPSWLLEIDLLHLNLSFNSLKNPEGHVSNHLSNLIVLDLHHNHLQGSIPFLPNSASYLDYSSNNLSTLIPNNIGAYLSRTMFFSLSSNKLYGKIPESICSASNLLVLDLSSNSLSGVIPGCLYAKNSTLGVLNLRRNKLNGIISDNFPDNCLLQTLDFSENLLEGKVPKSLANCTLLEVLNLGNNQINDTFPCHLKNRFSSLRVLLLRSNRFHGSIGCPENNGTWPILQIIDLASNNFRGKLPQRDLKTWEAMMANEDEITPEINIIQFNILELSQLYYQDAVTVTSKGLVMDLVKILTAFTSIDFSCNNFEGPVPEVMGEFKSLHFLNLSHNALIGAIPSAFGNLSQLESLDLSDNKFSGAIPTQLAELSFLSVLNLSYNQLKGKVPTGTQLQSFAESSFEGNAGLCGPPLSAKCPNSESLPPGAIDPEGVSRTEMDWQFLYGGFLGFGLGSGVVVGVLIFTKKGSKWCDMFIDQIGLAILHPTWLVRSLCDTWKQWRNKCKHLSTLRNSETPE